MLRSRYSRVKVITVGGSAADAWERLVSLIRILPFAIAVYDLYRYRESITSDSYLRSRADAQKRRCWLRLSGNNDARLRWEYPYCYTHYYDGPIAYRVATSSTKTLFLPLNDSSNTQ